MKTSNKNGQELGRKGRETRRRLMDATLQLLSEGTPDKLTAARIAAIAEVRPASFYVYFDNVQELLYDLSEEASREFMTAFEASDLFLDLASIEDDAARFIEMWNTFWARHKSILHFRDMQTSYGEVRYSTLSTESGIPVMDRLFRLVRKAYENKGGISNIDAYAEAVVLYTAIDRLAASIHRPNMSGIAPERLKAAQARIIGRTLNIVAVRDAALAD